MSVSLTKKSSVYATPLNISEAKDANSPIDKLNALYGMDKSAVVSQKFMELGLTLKTEIRIANALIYRNEKAPTALAAIQQVEALGNTPAFQELLAGMQALQGKFLAMFSAEQIPQATHHVLAHGVDMSHDPGDFIAPLLIRASGQLTPAMQLMMVTTSVLGAAHDIIQGKSPPPTNEIESAVIFCAEMQKMLAALLKSHQGTYSDEEVAALTAYKNIAVPFLAEEGIVNCTYLLFGSGKRDFDNVMAQISEIYIGQVPDLPPMIAAMKMGLSVSDTRRGEMTHLLEKMESLTIAIDRQQGPQMDEFLRAAGIFTADDALPVQSRDLKKLTPTQQEKCEVAEGFLLRLRPSINMVCEMAKVFQRDAAGQPVKNEMGKVVMVPDRVGAELMRKLRAGEEPGADFDYASQLDKFLVRINDKADSENAFANEIGALNKEIIAHAARYDVTAVLENNRLCTAWKHHSAQLKTLKRNLASDYSSQKVAIAKLMYSMAAISPGIIMGMGMTQDIYDGMIQHEQMLFYQSGMTDKLVKLSRDINEIEWLNPHTLRLSVERPVVCRGKRVKGSVADSSA